MKQTDVEKENKKESTNFIQFSCYNILVEAESVSHFVLMENNFHFAEKLILFTTLS